MHQARFVLSMCIEGMSDGRAGKGAGLVTLDREVVVRIPVLRKGRHMFSVG